jgi:hypothetical protein
MADVPSGKPAHIFDRDREWRALADCYLGAGFDLALQEAAEAGGILLADLDRLYAP